MSVRKNSLVIISIVLCGLSTFGNQLKNSSFENDWKHWRHSAGSKVPIKWNISKKQAHSGKQSLHISFSGDYKPNCYAMLWQNVVVKPSSNYKIKIWVKTNNANAIIFGGGKKWELRKATTKGTYDWKEFSYNIKTGPKDVMFTVRIFIENRIRDAWIDDISIEKVYKKDTKSTITVTQTGAVPDGKTDCTEAFQKAISSGSAIIVVPPGKYAIKSVNVATGVTLVGCGPESLIVPYSKNIALSKTKDNGNKLHGDESAPQKLLILSTGSEVKKISINGYGKKVVGISSKKSSNILISQCKIENTKSFGIHLDHVNLGTIGNNNIINAKRAINIDFSNNIRVQNNNVADCTQHGIQFWGNYNWKDENRCKNLILSGNIVKNGGAGAIWGTGYKNVIMSNNLIDGAEDVGLDLEWCDDSVIIGNVVHNAKNGGIALFFRCRRVTISGNTIINNWKWSKAPKDWWVRAGIWLTYPNTGDYKGDTGHEDINITGNSIFNYPGKRRAIWVGSSAKRIAITNNSINKDLIYFGGEHNKNGVKMDTFKKDPVYINASSKAVTNK